MRWMLVPMLFGGLLCCSGSPRSEGSLGIADAPIMYPEAEARSVICYAATLPVVGPKLLAFPRPRVIIDGRIAQAVDSTLTKCKATETAPAWLDSVDYLADARAYGSRATHGIVRIQSFTFTAFVKRHVADSAARAREVASLPGR